MKKGLLLFLIISIVPISQLAIDIFAPSLPHMADAFAVSRHAIQNTLTIYLIFIGIASIIIGPISDAIGRKPMVITALILMFIGSILALATTNYIMLMTARAIQGFAGGWLIASWRSFLLDGFTAEEAPKAWSNASFTYGLVPIIAPFIGGILENNFSWESNFYFVAIYTALAFLVTVMFYEETLREKHALNLPTLKTNYKTILHSRIFWGGGLSASFAYGMSLLFNLYAPFLLQNQLHFTPFEFGSVALIIGIGYLCGVLSNRKLVANYGPKTMAAAGIYLAIIASLVMVSLSYLWPLNIFVILIPTIIIVFSTGVIIPNLFPLTLGYFTNIAGSATGLMGLVNTVGAGVAMYIISHLEAKSTLNLAYIFLMMSGVMWIMFTYMLKRSLEKSA